MGDDNRKWVYGQVEETTHDAAMKIAAECGVHISRIVEEGLERLIQEYVKENREKIDPVILVRHLALESKRHKNAIDSIKQMAYMFVENPSDEGFDRLKEACDSVGIEVEVIMEGVEDKKHIASMINENGTMSRAELWLAENMAMGRMYYSADLLENAANVGIKKDTINRAKTKLGIKSKKEGNKWYWWLPESTAPKENGNHRQEEEAPF